MFFKLCQGGICVQPTCSSFSACLTQSLERQPDPLGAMTWRLQDQLLHCNIWNFYHKSDSAQFDDNYSCNTYSYSKVKVQMINPVHLPSLSCRLGCASLKKKSTGWSGLKEAAILSHECWMMIRTWFCFAARLLTKRSKVPYANLSAQLFLPKLLDGNIVRSVLKARMTFNARIIWNRCVGENGTRTPKCMHLSLSLSVGDRWIPYTIWEKFRYMNSENSCSSLRCSFSNLAHVGHRIP